MAETSHIRALPKDVVDRIAAGEVVQRPVSVVKELLENSLDAKSTSISIHVEPNTITISDNGCGIASLDLGLAATRFATSKLSCLDDFEDLNSFGFRGEALASVSLVSRLQIVSRTNGAAVGYRQEYQDGKPLLQKPKPQARTVGTTVYVRDLFYNLPHRKTRNEREEYARILTVVQSYAIHHAHVGFSCRNKANRVDFNTTAAATLDTKEPDHASRQVLKHVYGSDTQFLSFSCQQEPQNNDETESTDQEFEYRARGLVSHPSSSNKTSTLVLFVNDRLIECAPLKKALLDVYSGSKPIVYLAVNVPGTQVDVNVHPTKKQVALLFQDELIGCIERELRILLQSTQQSFVDASVATTKKRKSTELTTTNGSAAPQRPSTLVRTTRAAPAGALEPYLVSTAVKKDTNDDSPQSQQQQHVPGCPLSALDTTVPGAFAQRCTCEVVMLPRRSMVRPKRVVATHCTYRSILSLRQKLKAYNEESTASLLRNAVFVGQVSPQQCLVQCGVELWLWNFQKMAQAMFSQIALMRFGGMVAAQLGEPIDVTKVMAHALELEEAAENEQGNISETNMELAQDAATCLMDHAEMLEEYFSIGLEQQNDGVVLLKTLPVLLEGHEPCPGGLSVFLLRLATEVDWTDERPCFQGIMRELGSYYAQTSTVQHTLFPAISHLLVPTKQTQASMRKLTVLSNLYKAFER